MFTISVVGFVLVNGIEDNEYNQEFHKTYNSLKEFSEDMVKNIMPKYGNRNETNLVESQIIRWELYFKDNTSDDYSKNLSITGKSLNVFEGLGPEQIQSLLIDFEFINDDGTTLVEFYPEGECPSCGHNSMLYEIMQNDAYEDFARNFECPICGNSAS